MQTTEKMMSGTTWRDEQKRQRRELKSPDAMTLNQRLAGQAFPNHEGGYKGKRTPNPDTATFTARELFARLVAMYVSHRRNYRWAKV